jgi:TonB-dependent receptor
MHKVCTNPLAAARSPRRALLATALGILLIASGLPHGARAESTESAEPAGSKMSALQEITVTAQRTTEEQARAAQREAENIVNVMAYDEIRKLPVVNSGDAVRIIPGVQLETDTGEGRFVNIRGLDSDLSSTTFGGVRLPPTDVTTSPQLGSRAVSFDALPSEMIGAVTVTKTNRPEQEAEALGGTIDIAPKTVPLTGKPYIGDFRVGNGYEPLRGTHVKDYAGTFGGRFGGNDQPFSALGVFSYYEDARGVDDLEAAYVDNQAGGIPDRAKFAWDQRYYRQHKKRHVYGSEFGYAADPNNKWYIRYYDFGVVQDYNRNEFIFNFSGNPTVNPDGSFTDTATDVKTYRSTTETFDTRLAALGGSDDLGSVRLDYFLAHTQGLYWRPYNFIPQWQKLDPVTGLPLTTTVTYNQANSNYPSLAVTGGANPYDVSNYTLNNFSNSAQKSTTKDWSSKLNVAISTHWTAYPTEELKFGVGARMRKFDQWQNVYGASTAPAIPLSDAVFGGNVLYYGDRYNMGPLIGTTTIANAFANGAGFTNNPGADASVTLASTFKVSEDVYAGYGQYQFGFGKLGIFTGLRIESTKETFDAFQADSNGNSQPISSTHRYTDFLPSLQTRYEFTSSLVGRAIYSSTIARPGFNQLTPGLSINLLSNSVTVGNINIKPAHSHNIDLSLEDYLPHAGIVSFGLFYKNLRDYIVPVGTSQTFPNSGIFAALGGIPVPVLTFRNGSPARAEGYEFSFERRFIELPGLWNGFGASVNWTGISSRIEIRPNDFTTLPSTAKNTGNATLFYEREHVISLRLGANYTSRALFNAFSTQQTDVYTDAHTSLDFGSRYFITDLMSVYFNAKNLTNTPLTYSEGSVGRPLQREFYRQTYQLGFEASF